ncbi:MAG: c-type cytochrome [Gammaproteobacteria bacterium]|nr:c-type cytochrome [Gammaproteobacteria bacterium]
MKQLLVTFGFIALAGASQAASAANLTGGDAEAGKAKTTACVACHGADGNSANPEWPKLAGQHAGYLYEQLKIFKLPASESPRYNALMFGQAQALSDEDMKNIAAYYAEQATKPGVADPELAEVGEDIYRGGIPEENVAACIACHGPSGKGNAAANFPKLAGQHATYTVNQLKLYKSGERSSDMNQMMRNNVAGMSEEDMKAVAEYIQGLQD